MSTLKTLLIGSGRLARHLQHWTSLNNQLNKTNENLLTWNRSEPLEALEANLKVAHRVWLAISDQAVIPFFEKYLEFRHQVIAVHFSGALYDTRIIGAHPLMSFPNELLPDPVYQKVQFAVDESITDLQYVLPGFANRFFPISAKNKPHYHALCVATGNFPQILWSLCTQHFTRLNVPAEAVDLYIEQIADNFLKHKGKSLTGPLVRGDHKTIENNLTALNQVPDKKLFEIYKTFVEVYLK